MGRVSSEGYIAGKMNIIFTVDVEGHIGSDPVERLIYGETKNGELCGIDLLMDILDQYGIKGIFFVDIAEAWDYGKDKIGNVLKHIKERGHDVGVHIHPDHMADKKRLFLSEYERAEQYEIIKKCTDFYVNVLGERPKAFRAGKYGANWETLRILEELEYKADFSQFYGQKWCHIDPPCTYIRKKKILNGMVEIPVTVYRSFDKRFYSRVDKIDIGLLFLEFKKIIKEFLKRDYCDTIVLFAHSFSLINWRNKPNEPAYSRIKYIRMKRQLEYIVANRECRICKLDDIIGEANEDKKNNEDISLPVLRGITSWIALIYRVYIVLKSKIDIKVRKI